MTWLSAGCGATTSSATIPSAPSGSASPTLVASPTASAPSAPSAPSVSVKPVETFELFGALPNGGFGKDRAAKLQGVIDLEVKHGAPDVIAAVITPDGLWSGAAGLGGPDGRSATARDEFYIASLTKVFTAALIMRLVEQGKMDLDEPLASYLGDLKVDANHATVRQTLEMRSGLPDFGSNAPTVIAADPRHQWTVAELVAQLLPITAPAGTVYIYGNPGYVLLARAIEQVTGTSFAKALRRDVLDPVRATRVLQQGGGVDTPKPWALPTIENMEQFKAGDFGQDGVISCLSSVSFSFGGGSMASDAPSLAALTWHLFAGDVISRDSLTAMIPPTGSAHGIGIERLTDLGESLVFGQTGSKSGYQSILAVFPAERSIVVVFVNKQDYIVEPLVVDLRAAATGRT